MKFYLLQREWAKYDHYADFGRLGTWTEGHLCKKCQYSTERIIEPLLVEWNPGSDIIGSFSWCSYYAVITPEVQSFFINNNYPVKFAKVKVVEPEHIPKRKKIVAWPYLGPDLVWLKSTKSIPLDADKSGIPSEIICDECGKKINEFKMESLVINKENWNGEKIFYINQYIDNQTMYVTEDGRQEMLEQGFTNINYHEAGEII